MSKNGIPNQNQKNRVADPPPFEGAASPVSDSTFLDS
jgi:hypothetical protein